MTTIANTADILEYGLWHDGDEFDIPVAYSDDGRPFSITLFLSPATGWELVICDFTLSGSEDFGGAAAHKILTPRMYGSSAMTPVPCGAVHVKLTIYWGFWGGGEYAEQTQRYAFIAGFGAARPIYPGPPDSDMDTEPLVTEGLNTEERVVFVEGTGFVYLGYPTTADIGFKNWLTGETYGAQYEYGPPLPEQYTGPSRDFIYTGAVLLEKFRAGNFDTMRSASINDADLIDLGGPSGWVPDGSAQYGHAWLGSSSSPYNVGPGDLVPLYGLNVGEAGGAVTTETAHNTLALTGYTQWPIFESYCDFGWGIVGDYKNCTGAMVHWRRGSTSAELLSTGPGYDWPCRPLLTQMADGSFKLAKAIKRWDGSAWVDTICTEAPVGGTVTVNLPTHGAISL